MQIETGLHNNPFTERWSKPINTPSESRLSFERAQIDALMSAWHIKPNDKILEIGCGQARLYANVRQIEPSAKYVGIDLESTVLGYDASHFPDEQAMFVNGDMFHAPIADESFDAVISEGVIEHFSDWKSILDEKMRMLKPGGTFITSVPNLLNMPQTVSLAIQGENFRYYPERPFLPGPQGNMWKYYQELGLEDMRMVGWEPHYFYKSFYLYDKKTEELRKPWFTPVLRCVGSLADKAYESLLSKEIQDIYTKWFGYEFALIAQKPFTVPNTE